MCVCVCVCVRERERERERERASVSVFVKTYTFVPHVRRCICMCAPIKEGPHFSQRSYRSREEEKATFYEATPCRGAGVIAQKFYLGIYIQSFFRLNLLVSLSPSGKGFRPGINVKTEDCRRPKPADFM